ncbi:hypothetical protein DDI_3034 [Dickeya dianthicola RNS04.9]|nr:hypothetical protein DDI_3034 [Dickeya dianthicola RNS04.9]
MNNACQSKPEKATKSGHTAHFFYFLSVIAVPAGGHDG